MASWDLLDEKDEADLHKGRLLNVEEKPFKRITKRLSSVAALATTRTAHLPTPPPNTAAGDIDPDAAAKEDAALKAKKEAEQLKEDLILDFAAFDSSIARLQFLLDANARERERYRADQQRILAESEAVRKNNVALREQLEEARATLAQRKKFDELAEKITSNRLLRPREDQLANLKKLEGECRELEKESETYSLTWRERRDQFNKIMDEGMHLRRQIRDEKEEVERREGMNEDGEEADSHGGQTPRPPPSGNATPVPDSGAASTPRPTGAAGAMSTQGDSQGAERLKPRPGSRGTLSRGGSAAPHSRHSTPMMLAQVDVPEDGEDVDMVELPELEPEAAMADVPEAEEAETTTQAKTGPELQSTPAEGTPRVTVEGAAHEDGMEVDS